MNGRRWKMVRVSAELLSHMLTTGIQPVVEVRDGLPPDAEFDGEHYDPLTGTFHLRFRHDSFPEVPDCHRIPDITPMCYTATMEQREIDAFDRGMAAAEAAARWTPTDAPAVVEAARG